ncbi:hypothetical protein AB0K05_29790 [Nonomuraea sp. NPDC049486]|uniref:hypothetical protein n=1 Tax=Nonomuraea sp. NPDC049486 TaxID=3155773 RepID=UPI0034330DE8
MLARGLICLFVLAGSLLPAPAHAAAGWEPGAAQQVYDPKGKLYAYAPAAIEQGATEHYWTCHNTTDGKIKDDIWHTRRSGGKIVGDRRVIASGGTGWDKYHNCDPAVVAVTARYQGVTYGYAMFYLGNDVNASAHNQIGVAFAKTLDGPWVKYPKPVVAFPFDDPAAWGAGQPAVTAVDPAAGRLLLFYTAGGPGGTRAYRRDITLADMSAPVVGPAVEVTRAGLTGTDGKPDVLNNFDVAYDPSRDRFYAVREQHPYPTVAPKQIGASLQVASIDGASIWNGGGSWRVEGVIDPALTGLPRNHNAGIVRTVYGTLPDSGSLTVIFTESCAGTCASLWSYDLWRVTGTLT